MVYQFDTDDRSEKMREAVKCQQNLYSIPRGSFPLAREMGLPWDMVDRPGPEAENEASTAIIEQTQKYEPRIRIKECRFKVIPENGEISITIEQVRTEDDEYDD